MAKPRKMYASFTKAQEQSGFARKFGRGKKLGQELEKQANAGALDSRKIFQKNKAKGTLKTGWGKAVKSTQSKGIRNYVKGGATAGQGKRSHTQDTNSIKFTADPKSR